MQEIEIPPEEIDKLVKFKENFAIFNKKYSELQEHLGEYVAIGDGRVLGFSSDVEVLLNEYKNVPGLFVRLITPKNIHWIL